MKINTQSPLKVLALSIVFILHFSCSKDSDLLTDYVLTDAQEAIIGKYVVDDTFVVSLNGSVVLDVLSNDTFSEQASVIITETSEPANGTAVINNDDTITYTPETTEATVDTFTYTTEVIVDETVSTETGTVTIAVQDPNKTSGELKAFPAAYGGGSNATGGRGKVLCIINTLDDEGKLTYHAASGNDDEWYEGGLIPALRNADIGYIVFNLSGNITLPVSGTQRNYGFRGITEVENKTVFGQSSPKGGITITGGTFRFSSVGGYNSNLIFRYFRSRPIYDRNGNLSSEDDRATWALLFFGGNDIIVDHVSGSFAQDKIFGAMIDENYYAEGLYNLTFSNCFAQDGGTSMYVEINPGQANDPEQYVDNISFIKNVSVGMNRTPNLAFDGRADKINNVLHDASSKQSTTYHDIRINDIGNYYSRSTGTAVNKIRDDLEGFPIIYTSENYYEGKLNGSPGEDNKKLWFTTSPNPDLQAGNSYFTETKFPDIINPPTILSPQAAFAELITNGNVGAYKYLDDNGDVQIYRDSFDTSQLAIVANNQSYAIKNVANWVLPSIPNNTRPESYDTDNDGMSDNWEIANFGNLSQSYRGDYDGDGYENIEEYMNQVDFN